MRRTSGGSWRREGPEPEGVELDVVSEEHGLEEALLELSQLSSGGGFSSNN